MKNKLLRISITFLTIFLLVLNVCPISAFASSPIEFIVPFDRPTVSNNSGYVEVYWSDGVGNRYVDLYTWVFTPTVNLSNQDFMPTTNQILISAVVSDNHFAISFAPNDNVEGYLGIVYASNTGSYNISTTFLNGDSEPLTRSLSDSSGCNVRGYHIYGNIGTISGTITNKEDFIVSYGTEGVVTNDLAGILTTLNSLYYLTEAKNEALQTFMSYMMLNLNQFKGSFADFKELYISKMTLLLSYCEDYFQQLESIVTNTGDIVDLVDSLLQDFRIKMDELYWLELDSNTKLYEIKDTLDAILAILNAGKDKPTLQTPNDSIDSAFGDVSGWFGDIDGFGNQLEQNRQENQQNLAQAGNIISGFFSICPPRIIIALALCAIMIVVAKVIGR